DSEYLHTFLNFYEKDIQQFQPGQPLDLSVNQLVFFVLRNMVPAGLLLGEVRDGSDLHVKLDYAIPGYRDLKIGRFIYQEHSQDFRERGIQRIFTEPGAPEHARYLERMGFRPEGKGQYCLAIKEN